jgi:hypothetical protein
MDWKKNLFRVFNWLLLMVLFSSCEDLQFWQKSSKLPERTVVARAYDSFLYLDQMDGAVPPGISGLDSVRLAESFVRNWVVQQLMVREANAYLSVDMSEIDRLVQDYRYALISHEFQKQWISDKLSQEVSREEIEAYYDAYKSNFELKQNIIRGKFLKIPKEAPRQERLEGLLVSRLDKSHDELKSYCLQFATSYHIDDSVWINFDDMIRQTPYADIPGRVQFLRKGGYSKAEDEAFNYYLQIAEYKIADEISPLEFVEDNIKSIIVTQRRIELANSLEKDMYEKAKRNGDFEIIKP